MDSSWDESLSLPKSNGFLRGHVDDTASMLSTLEDKWRRPFDLLDELPDSVSLREKATTCPLCREQFRDPRLLPCLHTVCRRCVEGVVPIDGDTVDGDMSGYYFPAESSMHNKSGDERDDSLFISESPKLKSVTCPLCDDDVDVPRNADLLPEDLMVRDLLVTRLSSPSRCRSSCDNCSIGQTAKQNASVSRCHTCCTNLCIPCVILHSRNRLTAQHNVINLSESRSSNGMESTRKQFLCHAHPDEVGSVYCPECNDNICRQCILDHTGQECESNLAKSSATKNKFQIILASLSDNLANIERYLQEVVTPTGIEETANVTTRSINDYMDRYISAIEKHRERLLNQVEAHMRDKAQRALVKRNQLDKLYTNMNNCYEVAAYALKQANCAEVMSIKNTLLERANNLEKLAEKSNANFDSHIDFLPNATAEVIDDFQMFGVVIGQKVSPDLSSVDRKGLESCRPGERCFVQVRLVDTEGLSLKTVTDIDAWVECPAAKQRSKVSARRDKNGKVVLSFVPRGIGKHYLHVKIADQYVEDAPVEFPVRSESAIHEGARLGQLFQSNKRRSSHETNRTVTGGGRFDTHMEAVRSQSFSVGEEKTGNSSYRGQSTVRHVKI